MGLHISTVSTSCAWSEFLRFKITSLIMTMASEAVFHWLPFLGLQPYVICHGADIMIDISVFLNTCLTEILQT